MGFGLKMNGVPKAEITEKVSRASTILQLDPYLKRKPKALSGGQRQRVAIGRAIVRGPEVFLFDEPLSNLDAELRVDMRVEISHLHKEIGATMIYVTHDQVEAMTLADKIVVLRGGHIEQVGSPMDLYQNPDNKFVAGFIGSPSMNFVEGIVKNGKVRIPALADAIIDAPSALKAKSGTVTVGLRPQDMTLRQASTPIKVDIAEQLGGVAYEYLTTPSGERFVIETTGDTVYPRGTSVAVDFDPSLAMFFDNKTDQRLR